MKRLILAAAFALAPIAGHAQQGYTIYTPGQLPTQVVPNGIGGGSTIYTPGQLPTQVVPNGIGGGYTVYTPGQLPTQLTPNGGTGIAPMFGNR